MNIECRGAFHLGRIWIALPNAEHPSETTVEPLIWAKLCELKNSLSWKDYSFSTYRYIYIVWQQINVLLIFREML